MDNTPITKPVTKKPLLPPIKKKQPAAMKADNPSTLFPHATEIKTVPPKKRIYILKKRSETFKNHENIWESVIDAQLFKEFIFPRLPTEALLAIANVSKITRSQVDQVRIYEINTDPKYSLKSLGISDISSFKSFLMRNGHEIRSLNLDALDISIDDLKAILQFCPNLTRLHFDLTEDSPDASEALASSESSDSIDSIDTFESEEAYESEDLYEISASDELEQSYEEVEVESPLSLICSNLPNLKELILDECKNVTDDDIRMLVSQQNHLKKLTLFQCEKLTDNAAINIARELPKLTSLTLNAIDLSPQGYNAIAGLVHLSSLDLSYSNVRTINLFKILKNCQHLTHLALTKDEQNPNKYDRLKKKYPQVTFTID